MYAIKVWNTRQVIYKVLLIKKEMAGNILDAKRELDDFSQRNLLCGFPYAVHL